MHYCSLVEAWDEPNKINNQYKQHMESNKSCDNKSCDNKSYDNITQDNQSFVKNTTIEKFTQDEDLYNVSYKKESHISECDRLLQHIKNCKECSSKLRINNRPMILDNISELVNDNRDVIVLILMGMFIILFFNLINNITK
jgi:hypothetical protein